MNKKANMLNKLLVWCLLSIGTIFFLYPIYVDALNHFIDDKRVESMQQSMAKTSKAKEQAIAAKNKKVQQVGLQINGIDFNQTNVPRLAESVVKEHLVGKVSIPRINQDIPLFDQTSEQLLQEGATIVQGTSFPTGEAGETSLIAAHSGLPERKLFTDLDKVKMGDQFVLTVYEQRYAYEVEDIRVVLPEEIESIRMVPGKNLVTLVSCTPYMVNTHRLLVTGHRVPYKAALDKTIAKKQQQTKIRSLAILLGTAGALGLFGYQMFRTIRLYRLAKQHFDLTVKVLDETGQAISGMVVHVYQGAHRKPLHRAGEVLTAISDEKGMLSIANLPKQVYVLKETTTQTKIKIGFKKLKQTRQELYRSQAYHRLPNDEYLTIQRIKNN